MSLSLAASIAPLVVGLGLDREQTPVEERADLRRQVGQRKALLSHPMPPVFLRAVEHRAGPRLADVPLYVLHFRGIGADGHPVVDGSGLARGNRDADRAGAVHGALRDGVAFQAAVFGIAPGAFQSAHVLGAGGVGIQADVGAVHPVHPEERLALVMNERSVTRVVVGGVPNADAAEGEVVMEEEAHFSLGVGLVFNDDATQEGVPAIVNGIVEIEPHAQPVVLGGDVGDERVFLIAQRLLPGLVVDPGKLTVRPDAELERMPLGMVLLTHVGIVDVPDAVVAIEADEQTTVPYRQITWHLLNLWYFTAAI